MTSNIQIKVVTGKAGEPYILDLAALRCEIFREYPYLYDGNLDNEKSYVEGYAKHKDAVLILVLKDNKVVGCASGMPFENAEDDEFNNIFLSSGYDIKKIFLNGEFLLKKEFRGQGLGNVLVENFEKYIRSFEKRFQFIALFTIERPDNHPMRPKDYKDLSAFWHKHGFHETNMTAHRTYREVNETKETKKLMRFWLKEL